MWEICSGPYDWNAIGAMGQWASAIFPLVGFYFVWKQLRGERQVLEVQTSAQVYDSGIDALKTFVENGELRSYFYDCTPLPEKSEPDNLWSRVMTSCEIMCDQWENISLSGKALGDGTNAIWEKYMNGIYLTSPSMRYFLVQEGYRYDSSFIALFDSKLHKHSENARKAIEDLAKKNMLTSREFIDGRHKITCDMIHSMQATSAVADKAQAS